MTGRFASVITSNSRQRQNRVIESFITTIWVLLFIAVLATAAFALGGDGWKYFARFGGLVLLAGGSLLVGGLLGLIFAVPRSNRRNTTSPTATQGTSTLPAYSGNSNLEEISDWLTKMIVGIALIKWREIAQAIGGLRKTFEASLNTAYVSNELAGVGGVSLLGVYLGLGFVFGYMWSRVYLPNLLTFAERPDVDLLSKDQRLRLEVEAYLEGQGALDPSELTQLFNEASQTGRADVYFRMHRSLETNLRNGTPTDALVPLYKALIEAPGGRTYEQNHGEYALSLLNVQSNEQKSLLPQAQQAIGEWKRMADLQRNQQQQPWYPMFQAAYALMLIRSQSTNTTEIDNSINLAKHDTTTLQWMQNQSEFNGKI